MPRFLIGPAIVLAAALVALFFFGGASAAATGLLLIVLEITLSFDNAVVNAKVLQKMTPTWQKRFLTWGIFFAVVVTRVVLPILIVAFAVGRSPLSVASLAFHDAIGYAVLIASAKVAIASFGAAFLLMVSLQYFLDQAKEEHWIVLLERVLAKGGAIEAVEVALTLLILLGAAMLAPAKAGVILSAGIVGVVLFILMQGIANAFTLQAAGTAGFALFVYLNVLDAAFSLDGVIGAFALTTSLPVIIIGLGVGAYFVRSITLELVRRKTLAALRYLEHGAHYAILALALCMLASVFVAVPEIVTGGVGLLFIGAAYWSSVKRLRA